MKKILFLKSFVLNESINSKNEGINVKISSEDYILKIL